MKLILIEWLDSHGPSKSRWRPLEEIKEDNKPLLCRSVGWLVDQNEKSITLVPHTYGDDKNFVKHGLGEMAITKKAIVKMTVLRKKG